MLSRLHLGAALGVALGLACDGADDGRCGPSSAVVARVIDGDTVELEDGGTYVINKHAPTRQIWVSSPASGATHFARDQGSDRWIDTRGGRDLARMLRDEIRAATGADLALG